MGSFKFEIEPAAREWRRQFANVIRSFAKTVTEAVTNSDSSYKRRYALPDASGLVDLILHCPLGTRLDSSSLKQQLPQNFQREVQIHLFTAKGHDRMPRSCDIVDFAEGLSGAEIPEAFRLYAANKTEVSKGRPGRSLFGRGVSDVLLGHKGGELYSFKEGVLTHASFSFDPSPGKPRVEGQEIPNPSKQSLSAANLRLGENGTCVRFLLADDCRIPDEGTIVTLLSRFYMLRLINSDPSVTVRLFRYRGGGKVHQDLLDYDFPLGDVIGKFDFDPQIPKEITKKAFPPIRVQGIVSRADVEAPLKGRESRDARENGILIVDDTDAVLDLTFLPDFEGAPYLGKIFGLIRLSGIRPILEYFLDQGKESPLTTTRDGFDPRHEFTQFLFGELRKQLEPIYRKEEQRQAKGTSDELSAQAKQRLNEALRHLNRYLSELLGSGEGDTKEKPELKELPIQFVPSTTKILIGQPRFVNLFVRAPDADLNGTVMIDSSNPKVEVHPNLIPINKGNPYEHFLGYRVSLKCDALHERAVITALADGAKETLEARLEVTDVLAAPAVEPPSEMEFRPSESRGQPNRKNHAVLYANLDVIPLRRKLEFSLVKPRGIALLQAQGKKCDQFTLVLEPTHRIEGTNVARVLVPWTGVGWGQHARIMAETKTPGGKIVTALATVVIDQDEDSGLIKDVKYRDLGNQKCSDLVDGVIYINSSHALNRPVFGVNQEDYAKSVENDRTAQYRLCSILVEQSVFRLAEDLHLKNKLLILPTAPVTSIREFVDSRTHEFAPRLLKILMQ